MSDYSPQKTLAVVVGIIFLLTAIAIGLVYTNANGLVAFRVSMLGVVVAVFAVIMLARKSLPVKTITVTNSDGSTKTITTRATTRSYLVCPECGMQFTASGIGHREYGYYWRDPERFATRRFRWHLINVHHHDRLQAQKEARTAPFHHEDALSKPLKQC